MTLTALGYVGIRTTRLADWDAFATGLLGMQRIDKAKGVSAFRMDDRRQRLIVNSDSGDGAGYFGLEVANSSALDAYAAHLDRHNVALMRGTRALAAERHVADLVVFADPVGNRIEVFHGAETTSEPFRPGRSISGFRTGPLGMGHAVLYVSSIETALPFYRDVLGLKLSDYILEPFKAYFFHVNARHHSFALIESDKNGIHHLMVETCMLDDVGQGYDVVLRTPEKIGTTLGRHVNDEMTSFYTWSPSGFMFEMGWGGRSIDPTTWVPHERKEGPSIWGHDRSWLPPDKQQLARDMRRDNAQAGLRMPINVMDGNYTRAEDVCPWWGQHAGRRATGG